MPESVTDRCTKAHEYVFLLTKSERYFYDAEAVKEQSAQPGRVQTGYKRPNKEAMSSGPMARGEEGFNHQWAEPDRVWCDDTSRNRRSVWTITPKPYRGAHFAVWPPELVRPMILAGCPVGGTVLDPFSGSATTGMVALQEGRNYIGTDLNAEYLPLAEARVREEPPPDTTTTDADADMVLDLFGGY